MNLKEIKEAIAQGKKVKWSNDGYDVIKDKIGQYLIVFSSNDYTIGLTHQDGVTLNGKEEDFYIVGEEEPQTEVLFCPDCMEIVLNDLGFCHVCEKTFEPRPSEPKEEKYKIEWPHQDEAKKLMKEKKATPTPSPSGKFIEVDGHFECDNCGYELSAVLGDDQIPDNCEYCHLDTPVPSPLTKEDEYTRTDARVENVDVKLLYRQKSALLRAQDRGASDIDNELLEGLLNFCDYQVDHLDPDGKIWDAVSAEVLADNTRPTLSTPAPSPLTEEQKAVFDNKGEYCPCCEDNDFEVDETPEHNGDPKTVKECLNCGAVITLSYTLSHVDIEVTQ